MWVYGCVSGCGVVQVEEESVLLSSNLLKRLLEDIVQGQLEATTTERAAVSLLTDQPLLSLIIFSVSSC